MLKSVRFCCIHDAPAVHRQRVSCMPLSCPTGHGPMRWWRTWRAVSLWCRQDVNSFNQLELRVYTKIEIRLVINPPRTLLMKYHIINNEQSNELLKIHTLIQNAYQTKLTVISPTYDHRVWKTGLPVRSAVLKPHAGRLVAWWVTTSESRLLYVLPLFFFFFVFFCCCPRYDIR